MIFSRASFIPNEMRRFVRSMRLLLRAGPPALALLGAACSGSTGAGGSGGGAGEPGGGLAQYLMRTTLAQMQAVHVLIALGDEATLDECAPSCNMLAWMSAVVDVQERAQAKQGGRGAWPALPEELNLQAVCLRLSLDLKSGLWP